MASGLIAFAMMFAIIFFNIVWRLFYDLSYNPYDLNPHLFKMPRGNRSKCRWIAVSDDDEFLDIVDSVDLLSLDVAMLADSYLIGRGKTPRGAVTNLSQRWLAVAEEIDLTAR